MNKLEQQHLPIGVFDSGVGGLSVLKVLKEQFPHEHFIYIGDNKNNPVGNRPTEEIENIASRIAERLDREPVKMLVIACNTFTVVAIDAIRNRVHCPVIGVSQGMQTTTTASHARRVAVMATVATINSHIHKHVALEYDPEIVVWEEPCPELAGLIEGGHIDDEPVLEALREYLAPIMAEKIDAVVLGCTHFPFVQTAMESISKDSIHYIDPAYETSDVVRRTLESGDLLNPSTEAGTIRLWFTQETDLAATLCQRFMKPEDVQVKVVTL